MPHKHVRTRKDIEKMQEYHLRLAFHLSKAETVLRIQIKRDGKSNKLLLCCSKIEYICSVYSPGKEFSLQKTVLRKLTR